MGVTSTSGVVFSYEGDIVQPQQLIAAASNASCPGSEQLVAVSSSPVTVTKPAGAVGCIVQKPAGNTVVITLKGVSGDSGVQLALTDPDRLSLGAAQAAFVLVAASAATIRLIWL